MRCGVTMMVLMMLQKVGYRYLLATPAQVAPRLLSVQSTPAAVMSGRVEGQGCRKSVDDLQLRTSASVNIVTLLSD